MGKTTKIIPTAWLAEALLSGMPSAVARQERDASFDFLNAVEAPTLKSSKLSVSSHDLD